MRNILDNIFLAICILVIGSAIWFWALIILFAMEAPVETNLSDKRGDMVMVQGNSLIAISPLVHIRTVVLGSLIEAVIACESGGDNTKIGKAGEIGLCQFKKQTWDWMCGLADFNGDIYNEADQKWLIKWAFDNNLEEHWTCFKILKR